MCQRISKFLNIIFDVVKASRVVIFPMNGVYFQSGIKGAVFSATSAWDYFSSLFINFIDLAIGYVTSGRAVSTLCVCVCDASFRNEYRISFQCLGPPPQILSAHARFKVVCKESPLWDDLIHDGDGKWKFHFCFYFGIFLLFWFPFKY